MISEILVIGLAIGNTTGRIILGVLSDKLHTPRQWIITACLFLMSLAIFGASWTPFCPQGPKIATALIPVAVFVGFAFGGLWSVVPTILSETFGMTNFGKVLLLHYLVYGFTATLTERVG